MHTPKKGVQFKCETCDSVGKTYEFETKHEFKMHNQEFHPNPFMCENCESTFKTSVTLDNHRIQMRNSGACPKPKNKTGKPNGNTQRY